MTHPIEIARVAYEVTRAYRKATTTNTAWPPWEEVDDTVRNSYVAVVDWDLKNIGASAPETVESALFSAVVNAMRPVK